MRGVYIILNAQCHTTPHRGSIPLRGDKITRVGPIARAVVEGAGNTNYQ
jgi:hypothetical protein